MNKQMTPAEIGLVRQSFVRLSPNKAALIRFAPISNKAALGGVAAREGQSSDTNDTKSNAGDIAAIQRGRTVVTGATALQNTQRRPAH